MAANSTANSEDLLRRRAGANGWAASRRRRSPPPGRCCAKSGAGGRRQLQHRSRFAPSLEPVRAGTSRVRSVRGSRRAREPFEQSAGSALGEAGDRGRGGERIVVEQRLQRALAPFARGFGAASASFCARRRSSAARSQACPAPLAQANRMRVVSAPSLSVVARRPADANSGAASSGSANGQFSFWASTESASQAARSSPAPPRSAAGEGAADEFERPRGGERRRARPARKPRRRRSPLATPRRREVQGVGGARDRGAPLSRPIRS